MTTGGGKWVAQFALVFAFLIGAVASAQDSSSSTVDPSPAAATAPASGVAADSEPAPESKPESAPAEVESSVDDSSEEIITIEEVKAELAKLPEPTADSPASRDYTALQSAVDALQQEAKWQADLKKLRESTARSDSGDKATEKANAEADEMAAKSLPDALEVAEREVKSVSLELEDTRDRISDLTTQVSSAPQRRLQQTQQRNALRGALADAEEPGKGDDPETILARAKRQATEAQLDYLDAAIATADTAKDFRASQLAVAKIRADAMDAYLERLHARVKLLREADLEKQEQAMQLAARQAANQSPVMVELAKNNSELLSRRKQLSKLLESVVQEREQFRDRADLLEQRLEEIQQRVEISGFSQAAAAIMLKELRQLPMVSQLETEQRKLEIEVRETQLELFDLTSDLTEAQTPLEQLEAMGQELSDADRGWLQRNEDLDSLQELLAQARELNQGLRDDANRYFEALLATDSEIMATIQATAAFRAYASENILWIPSRDILSTRDVSSLPGLMGSAMDEFSTIMDSVIKGPVMRTLVLLVCVILLVLLARFLAKKMVAENHRAIDWSEYSHTLKLAAFESFVAAVPLVILHLIAWTLDDPLLDGDLSNAIEYAARGIAPALFTLVLLYRITRKRGMAETQLRWPVKACAQINRAIKLFMFPGLGFALASSILDQYSQIIDSTTGARVFLLPAFGCCLAAFHVLFSPKHGMLAESSSPFWRESSTLRWSVYVFIMGWQLFLSVLVIGGYMLGAIMLWGHTFRTFWLIAGVLIIKGLVQRYLEVQQWRAKMQQLDEEAKGQEMVSSDRLSFSLDDSSKQVIGFLQWIALILGVSAVWSDAFPSLRKLGSQSLIAFGETTFVTLGQGGMLVVCIVTTVLLARSLPRLLEIIMIRRIRSIDPGTRHAIGTLMVYFVVIVGVIWASVILRIEWGNVQWLVAAISVGLGFGMQEIFGNLVAGIILLFERPIRVGDIVTVGDTTGVVTRIQMRGTTIREWDRRELIVPNKAFVTGQLTNWTLSDTLTRLTLKVGVAYGSDISKVKEVLMAAIKKDVRVLKDPAPAVFFTGFGDSSLDFVCFAFLGTLDERLGCAGDLQQNIYEAFSEAGITIPFPQRDLHIIDGGLPAAFGGGIGK